MSNTKISSYENKYLQEIVVNAGLFPAPPDRLVFLGERSPPKYARYWPSGKQIANVLSA